MPIVLYTTDHCPVPLPPGHKFPMGKYGMVRQLLQAGPAFVLRRAPQADEATIALAHDPGYVRAFLAGTLDPRVMRRIGFPWSAELVRRTLASVGGTLAAARAALVEGIAGNLAGGTHHAFRGEGSGFCVFNDLAVAIHALRGEGRLRRAAVLDLDVHQGDGTAAIFAGDAGVLTVSLHGRNNFPFRKQTSVIDIALPDSTSDEDYLAAVECVLPKVWEFQPDLLLYQSGVDALAADRLGRLAMTPAGLMQRDRMVFEAARRHGIAVAVTLGGGYAEPLEATAQAHAGTFRAAASVWGAG